MNNFGLQTLHYRLALFLSSEVASTSLLILLLNLPLLFFLQHLKPSSSSTTTQRHQRHQRHQPYQPLWLRTFTIIETALEFPFIHAFHPTTLAYPTQSILLPYLSTDQLLLQIAILCAIELFVQYCILKQFIDISVSRSGDPSKIDENTLKWGVRIVGMQKTSRGDGDKNTDDDDGTAEKAMLDFMRPRAALLLGVAVLGTPSVLTRCVGTLRPAAIVGWLILGQILEM